MQAEMNFRNSSGCSSQKPQHCMLHTLPFVIQSKLESQHGLARYSAINLTQVLQRQTILYTPVFSSTASRTRNTMQRSQDNKNLQIFALGRIFFGKMIIGAKRGRFICSRGQQPLMMLVWNRCRGGR